MNDTGKISIHGKEYKTVALRINEFRAEHPDYRISTEIITSDESIVVMKATVTNADGFVIATGHAEEVRASSRINKTSALENAETSAVGRALAFYGLAGSEIASADEVANAIQNQNRQSFDSYAKKESGNQADKARAYIDGQSWSEQKKEAMKKNLDDPIFCGNVLNGRVK